MIQAQEIEYSVEDIEITYAEVVGEDLVLELEIEELGIEVTHYEWLNVSENEFQEASIDPMGYAERVFESCIFNKVEFN